jgi:hypothetical protein
MHWEVKREESFSNKVSIYSIIQYRALEIVHFQYFSFAFRSWRSIVIYDWYVLLVRRAGRPFFCVTYITVLLSVRSGTGGGTWRSDEDSRLQTSNSEPEGKPRCQNGGMGVIRLGSSSSRGPSNGQLGHRSTVDLGGACPLRRSHMI